MFDAYLDYATKKNKKQTLYEKKLILQGFVDRHGRRLVRDLKAFDLTTWIDSHPGWNSEWTRSNAVKYLKAPFNWAIKQGLIDRNPFAAVEQTEGPGYRPMTNAEFLRLLRAARTEGRKDRATSSGRRFREVLLTLRLTGARPAEVRSLTWVMVNVEDGLAAFPDHKTRRKTKSPRVIYLVPKVVKLLQAIGRRDGFVGFVFRTHRGGPWSRDSIQ